MDVVLKRRFASIGLSMLVCLFWVADGTAQTPNFVYRPVGQPQEPEVLQPRQEVRRPVESQSDIQLLFQGRTDFETHCLKCHDAQKSMGASKGFEDWMKTIRRMNTENEATIPEPAMRPIATYLTLIAGAGGATGGAGEAAMKDTAKDNDKAGAEKAKADPQKVAAGRDAFNSSCISCHDADKSTSKTKSKGEWLSTITRMASKQGANIPAGSYDAIAEYLTSLSGAGAAGVGGVGASKTDSSGGGLSVSGTFSPTWRGGNDNLQNGGFFPDVWLTGNWNANSVLSGQVTACVSCHTTADGMGDRFELVEAKLRLDISSLFDACTRSGYKIAVEGGRFIVPFGAFSSQSNPAAYRTVSRPLIYNMGQRVHDGELGDPVLPMPYSDEGGSLSINRSLDGLANFGMVGYVVNGLQSDRNGINFDQSRDYVASNNSPSFGSRVTLGIEGLNLGGSIITGQSSPTGGFENIPDRFYYRIYGYDVSYKIPSLLRFQFEYARRDSDRAAPDPDSFRVGDRVSGYYLEGEYYSQLFQRLSYIARYDAQDRRSDYAPDESSIGLGALSVSRFTYGVNFNFRKAGLLMVNHERWNLPGGLERTDVLGVRWVYSF